MKVSIFDVAKKAGLSVVTVSRVLNGAESVREKNRQKVLDVIKELHYRPNAAAQSLASGKTGIIGLIMTTLQDSFFDAVVKEVNDILEQHGYFLAVSVSQGIQSEESHYLIQEDRVDGLILLSPIEEDNYIVEMKRRKIPYVLIDNQKSDNDTYSITIDNYQGGYTAARHLLDLGHTSIAHLSGNEMFRATSDRRNGFLQALQEVKLEPFEILLGDYDIEFGYQSAKRWVSEGTLPSAVFAGDDFIAIGVINALMEAGIRVPEQVSVIGYDDQDIASKLRPYLTTIRQPGDRIGVAATDMLLKRIAGTMKRSSNLQLAPELIVRDSTARKL
ncbi:LacI family transcriptional regulator [Paenibacillus baekrokdamisoli]|uniref:LacI family transcriptional regulator n=1 Tax=Paenibacillus baekrokdamisoli TaxID=1712516 RepID=A0A3G9JD56_9BACL|nr:LacI family DNA-binding transcriptional regulator [Paenibacillus baekrokdamisoli]MBB3068073.1 DNA-binding LacI/PurR family transcriptional regulator [Paenibacillus baekrokdamisoli]BBH22883.1 LacI family transcriptional regulator [Paenibacillus baekrokdamisoli]